MEPINKTEKRLKSLLAKFLGVETEDIDREDSLVEDLHMSPSDIADFLQILETEGLDTSRLDLTETESFEQLADFLSTGEE